MNLENTPPLPNPATPKWKSALALLILSTYILLAIFKTTHKGPAAMLPSNVRDFMVFSVAELGLFGVFWLRAVKIARADADELLLRWRDGWKTVWRGLLYSIGLRLAPGIALVWLLSLAAMFGLRAEAITKFIERNGPAHDTVVSAAALASDPLYKLILLTWGSFVVAGLREELWRAAMLALGARLLQPAFSQRGAAIGALVFSSLLFGAGHLYQGWIAVVLTALIGAMLGAIMLKHRSIWPAVIAHGAFDALSFAMLSWAKDFVK